MLKRYAPETVRAVPDAFRGIYTHGVGLAEPKRLLFLDVPDEELARRRENWTPPEPPMTGGYQRLYFDHVMQADTGCDLDFLVGNRGAAVPRESH